MEDLCSARQHPKPETKPVATPAPCTSSFRPIAEFSVGIEYAHSPSLEALSNGPIVDRCQNAIHLGSDVNSTKVIRILPDIVVKTGVGVRQQEATTLDYVYRHIDGALMRVPKVFRFFTHGTFAGLPIGYIVMEYVDGITLDKATLGRQLGLIKRIAGAINHLSHIPIRPQQGPGPVYGGEPRGYLWTDYGACTSFSTVQEMEHWLNQRLQLSGRSLTKLDLSSATLMFCHMDIARRNILITPDDEICFVDWDFAGFYPLYFQRFCLEYCSSDEQYFVQSLLYELRIAGDKKQDLVLGEIIRINSIYPPPLFR